MTNRAFIGQLVSGSILSACFSLRLGVLILGVHRRRA